MEKNYDFRFPEQEMEIAEGKYIIKTLEEIGEGAFGKIFLGKIKETNEYVAIKLEVPDMIRSQLETEYKIYKILKGGVIPKIYWYGKDLGGYNIMVMECLGRNLEQIFQNQNYNFSLKTICLLAEQMFSRIEFFHSKNFIHRDIKPENFIMGTLENNKNVYLIDFGLAKRFKNKNGLHIPYRDGKHLTGTLRYASCNNHLGIEQSRRDDIESIGYVLLYFFKKNLPWMNVKGKNEKEKLKKILDIKINSKLSDICQGIPKEIELIIQYSRDLKFDEKPNYDLIQRLIKGIGEKNGFTFDYMFDWICDDEKKKKEKENKEIQGNLKE